MEHSRRTSRVSKRAVATAAAARLPFEMLRRPRRAFRRAPDNEKRALALNCHQRLGFFDLLRRLQGFLGHFGFPSFDLPGWASPCVHAKRSPNLGVVSPIRNPLNLWHFAFDRALAHSATHVRSVELITAC